MRKDPPSFPLSFFLLERRDPLFDHRAALVERSLGTCCSSCLSLLRTFLRLIGLGRALPWRKNWVWIWKLIEWPFWVLSQPWYEVILQSLEGLAAEVVARGGREE